MVVFKSNHPDIEFPADITIWQWLYGDDSKYSPINRFPEDQLKGFTDASTGERLSWKQVKENATHISTALSKKYGFREGETITLFSQNSIWYPTTLFGAIRIGGVASGASPAYSVEEMTYALKTASARFIATHPTSMEVALQAAKNVGIPKEHIFLLEGKYQDYTTVKDLVKIGQSYGVNGQAAEFKLPPGTKNKDVCAFLSFSSGTTGLPKAVMIAHQNVIAQAQQMLQIAAPDDNDKAIAVLPLFHISGIVHSMNLPVAKNAEVVMLPNFSMEGMLDALVKYQISEVLLVPPILLRMVRDPIVDKYDLSCVKRFACGAAPASEEILQLLASKFPGTGFKQGYGMTESCSCITAHPPDKYDFKYAHKVGSIVANTEVKIMKEDGTECGVGEPGEIWARGPQVVMGYLNNEKATKETFDQDGFLHTGDQGVMDEEGMISITDRIKELIKVKGIGVAPAELEDLLLGHEKIEDCAVLGIPDDWAGEKPKAYVVLKPGVKKEEAVGLEILDYVQANKVRHKWLKEIEFIDEIPKSGSGKILRRILKDQDKKGPRGLAVQAKSGQAKL